MDDTDTDTNTNTSKELIIAATIAGQEERDKNILYMGLDKLTKEDQTLRSWKDEETSMTYIAAPSILSLDFAIDHLKRTTYGTFITGAPKPLYRETITKPIDLEDEYARQINNERQSTSVKLRLTPLPPDSNPSFIFEDNTAATPAKVLTVVRKSIEQTLSGSPRIVVPIVNIKVSLLSIAHNPTSTTCEPNSVIIKGATSIVFRKAFIAASPVILEALVGLELISPTDKKDSVTSLVTGKQFGGKVLSQEAQNDGRTITRTQMRVSQALELANAVVKLGGRSGLRSDSFQDWQALPSDVTKRLVEAADRGEDDTVRIWYSE